MPTTVAESTWLSPAEIVTVLLHLRAHLLRQRLADEDGVRCPEQVVDLSLLHLGGELGDLDLAARVDTGQRDSDMPAGVMHQRRGLLRRRDRAGQPGLDGSDDRIRVLDSRPSIRVGQVGHLYRAIFPLGGLGGGRPALVADGHVRQRIHELPDEIALGAFHQARDHDGEPHSDGNAENPDQGLPECAS